MSGYTHQVVIQCDPGQTPFDALRSMISKDGSLKRTVIHDHFEFYAKYDDYAFQNRASVSENIASAVSEFIPKGKTLTIWPNGRWELKDEQK